MAAKDDHEPGCMLDPVYVLRHAVAACELAMAVDDDEHPYADRLSATSLLISLEHFAEREDWRTVTLLEVVQDANLMRESKRPRRWCTCRKGPSDDLRTSRDW